MQRVSDSRLNKVVLVTILTYLVIQCGDRHGTNSVIPTNDFKSLPGYMESEDWKNNKEKENQANKQKLTPETPGTWEVEAERSP